MAAMAYWKRRARKVQGEIAEAYQAVGSLPTTSSGKWHDLQVQLLDALSHGEKEIERLMKLIPQHQHYKGIK